MEAGPAKKDKENQVGLPSASGARGTLPPPVLLGWRPECSFVGFGITSAPPDLRSPSKIGLKILVLQ